MLLADAGRELVGNRVPRGAVKSLVPVGAAFPFRSFIDTILRRGGRGNSKINGGNGHAVAGDTVVMRRLNVYALDFRIVEETETET